jgi:hypothetical protein
MCAVKLTKSVKSQSSAFFTTLLLSRPGQCTQIVDNGAIGHLLKFSFYGKLSKLVQGNVVVNS